MRPWQGTSQVAGFSDYSAQNWLRYITGAVPVPSLPSVFLALFTTPPTGDSGVGAAEPSGNGYARLQIAGTLVTSDVTAPGNNVLNFGSAVPSWIKQGMTVRDVSSPAVLPLTLVQVVGSSTVTLQGNAIGAGVGAGDTISFSAFGEPTASVGVEPFTTPAQVVTSLTVTFPTPSGSWGTISAWGCYDALSGGNLLDWDWLGAFTWQPFTCVAGSPGTLTSAAHGLSNGDKIAVSTKYGGNLPTTSGSWAGVLTVANATADTFTAGVNTTGTGDGAFRKISQISPFTNLVVSVLSGQLTLTTA